MTHDINGLRPTWVLVRANGEVLVDDPNTTTRDGGALLGYLESLYRPIPAQPLNENRLSAIYATHHVQDEIVNPMTLKPVAVVFQTSHTEGQAIYAEYGVYYMDDFGDRDKPWTTYQTPDRHITNLIVRTNAP